MSPELARARTAFRAKRRAELAYRAAVVDAVNAGHSYAEIAAVLGVSRQTVRVLVARAV